MRGPQLRSGPAQTSRRRRSKNAPLLRVRRQLRGPARTRRTLVLAAQPPEQVGARRHGTSGSESNSSASSSVSASPRPARRPSRPRPRGSATTTGDGDRSASAAVQRGDLRPVGVLRPRRPRVERRDRRLHLVRAGRAERHRAVERRQPSSIMSRSQRARSWSSSRTSSPAASTRASRARVLQQHQREQAQRLRLVGHELDRTRASQIASSQSSTRTSGPSVAL